MEYKFKFDIFEDVTEYTLWSFSDFVESIPDGVSVEMDVCSYGGDIFSGIAIIQKMQGAQRRGVTFNSRVYGLAASCAADIALSCDHVSMAKSSTIMIHSAWNPSGKADEGIAIANAAQLAVINKRLPKYSAEDLKVDRWFTADQALAIGLVDSVFDVEQNTIAARLCAKIINKHKGEFDMDEIKKVEEMEEKRGEEFEEIEKVEEKKEEEKESPSLEDVLNRIVERLDDINERVKKLENVNAECGDARRDDRLGAIYKKISAICAPCDFKQAKPKTETPAENLERSKAMYPNLDAMTYID